jgi:DNA primase
MAKTEATTVDAGGRELRVSSPDRVIFPKTERTPELTKLDVVEYYLAVEDGIMRALGRRPTTLERWPKGVHEGIVPSTREKGGGDAFFQKRVPRGAPEYLETARIEFPSGRHADEICPTEIAVVGWCGQMGTITFHPWPVRREDVDHPDELRLDLDPQPGTDFPDAVRVAAEARALLDDLGYVAFPKTSARRLRSRSSWKSKSTRSTSWPAKLTHFMLRAFRACWSSTTRISHPRLASATVWQTRSRRAPTTPMLAQS